MMKRILKISLILLFMTTATLAAAYWWLFSDLPAPSQISDHLITPSIRITDRHGRTLYDVIDTDRGRHVNLPLSQIPLRLQQATIATEDRNFYTNQGVDLEGIGRAFWINLRGGEVVAGGSTITQQVARNLLLSDAERAERTIRRKLRESYLAWRVARALEKDEILALYLNQIYYGGLAYGVEAAAQTYFGKGAADLTLAESALIAGIPQSPSLYNPLVNPEAAKARQETVLGLMLKGGMINQAEHDLAVREPLQYAADPYPIAAPHFVMMVQAELDGRYTPQQLAESGGLIVRTTLDLDWQQHGEAIVATQIDKLNNPEGGYSRNADNAALVALDPRTGDVLTLVGSPNFFNDEISGAINMALSPRQPGSALKPFVYAAAMNPNRPHPFTAATMLLDVRTAFTTRKGETYIPVNFSRTENGPVLVRQALASSLNIPAVLTLDEIGMATMFDTAADLGIRTLGRPDNYDLSFALGGGAVRLFDLTAAYAALANGGQRIEPRLILDIKTIGGETLWAAPPPSPVRVLDARVAWLISDILSDNAARLLSFGPNSLLQIGRTAAAKTGTTNDFHDNWTLGYTPDLAVGVWVGNADNSPMVNVTGISGAGPIWHNFMRTVLAGQPDKPFLQPDGLIRVEVCALSGLLPTEDCPYRRREWFIAGTQPTAADTFYHRLTLDQRTGQLADTTTPLDARESVLALDLPPEAHAWARSQNIRLVADLTAAPASAVIAQNTPPLTLISPDRNTTYQLSPELPQSAQRMRLAAITGLPFAEVEFWIDEVRIATAARPYEAWWPLALGQHVARAEGVDGDGQRWRSEPIYFEVRPPDDDDGPPDS